MFDKLVDELAIGFKQHRGFNCSIWMPQKNRQRRSLRHTFLDAKELAITNALKQNDSLTALRISNHAFGDKGAFAIAQLMNAKLGESCSDRLVNEPRLVSFDLENNEISCNGAVQIAEALRINRVLTHLNISSNPIANRKGFLKLLNHLRFKSSLISLNLFS